MVGQYWPISLTQHKQRSRPSIPQEHLLLQRRLRLVVVVDRTGPLSSCVGQVTECSYEGGKRTPSSFPTCRTPARPSCSKGFRRALCQTQTRCTSYPKIRLVLPKEALLWRYRCSLGRTSHE